MTEEGYCATLYSMKNEDIFRMENLHPDYRFHKTNDSSLEWEERALDPDQTIGTFPLHVLSAGATKSLKIKLKIVNGILEETCKAHENGFRIALHNPGEIPNISKEYTRVPIRQEVVVALTPRIFNTSEGLHDYSPEKRQCYLKDERYLRFFRIYTQRNCELECLSNYTAQRCGCVKFSMPRDNATGECNQTKCYKSAEVELTQKKYLNSSQGKPGEICNCLPLCESITYNADISQGDFMERTSPK